MVSAIVLVYETVLNQRLRREGAHAASEFQSKTRSRRRQEADIWAASRSKTRLLTSAATISKHVLSLAAFVAVALCCGAAWGAEAPGAIHFRQSVQPILQKYCSDCHFDGMKKGGVAFDEFKSDDELLGKHDLWAAVLKNLRAGLMPPEKKPRPLAEEQQRLAEWIKFDAFGLDPRNLDPGRVTVRRLNRIEYRNTIRDLMGIE